MRDVHEIMKFERGSLAAGRWGGQIDRIRNFVKTSIECRRNPPFEILRFSDRAR